MSLSVTLCSTDCSRHEPVPNPLSTSCITDLQVASWNCWQPYASNVTLSAISISPSAYLHSPESSVASVSPLTIHSCPLVILNTLLSPSTIVAFHCDPRYALITAPPAAVLLILDWSTLLRRVAPCNIAYPTPLTLLASLNASPAPLCYYGWILPLVNVLVYPVYH